MIYGYARVPADGQSVDAQMRQLIKARSKKVVREVASGSLVRGTFSDTHSLSRLATWPAGRDRRIQGNDPLICFVPATPTDCRPKLRH
jgi:hypothetical protein